MGCDRVAARQQPKGGTQRPKTSSLLAQETLSKAFALPPSLTLVIATQTSSTSLRLRHISALPLASSGPLIGSASQANAISHWPTIVSPEELPMTRRIGHIAGKEFYGEKIGVRLAGKDVAPNITAFVRTGLRPPRAPLTTMLLSTPGPSSTSTSRYRRPSHLQSH